MAKIPSIKIPKLKQGQKYPITIGNAKIKNAKLAELNKKLIDLTGKYQATAGQSSGKKSKVALAKIAELQAELKKSIAKQKAIIQSLEAKDKDKINSVLGPILKKLTTECSDSITAFKKANLVLLRGTSGKVPVAYKGKSWKARQVRDSVAISQELYDAALKKMKITALRSNSIFVTSDKDQAESYGELFVIFPKNGFQFSWSKLEPDIVLDQPEELLNIKFVEAINSDIEKYTNKIGMDEFFDLTDHLMEYGIVGTQKYLKEIKYPKADLVTADNLVDAGYIKKNYAPTNKNFVEAIRAGGEIMISGEYYAFKLTQYESILAALGLRT